MAIFNSFLYVYQRVAILDAPTPKVLLNDRHWNCWNCRGRGGGGQLHLRHDKTCACFHGKWGSHHEMIVKNGDLEPSRCRVHPNDFQMTIYLGLSVTFINWHAESQIQIKLLYRYVPVPSFQSSATIGTMLLSSISRHIPDENLCADPLPVGSRWNTNPVSEICRRYQHFLKVLVCHRRKNATFLRTWHSREDDVHEKMTIWELGIPHLWKKQGTVANSDPEEFEHCSKWQELKTCISEHVYVEVKISRL